MVDRRTPEMCEKEAESRASEGPPWPARFRSTSSCSSEGARAPSPADKQPAAPDGGWGWVVLLATILVLALTLAFPSCIGIFYTDLQSQFHANNSETSWVPSIMTAVLHAGGPLCSVLVEHYGCRVTVMLGGLLSGIGMATSSFTQSIGQLYITAGVITGLGFCLSFQPAIAILGHYFVRRRAFANSLASTGTAIGLSTLPLFAHFLLTHMGWRGSFLILGAVLLNCCVCGAVMRPVHQGSKKPNRTRGQPDKIENELSSTGHHRASGKLAAFLAALQKHMAFDLFCSNKRYQIYSIGVTWMMLGFVVPLLYLVPYATSHGMEQKRAALLLSILGLINIFMRPLAGIISELHCFSGKHIYLFSGAVLVNGLSNCICGIGASFSVLLAFVGVYALSMSFIGSLLFQVLMEIVEMPRFPSALGLITIMESVTLLIGPPLGGLLVDSTQEYKYVFYACCCAMVSSALFMGVAFYLLERDERKTMDPPKHAAPLSLDCQYTGITPGSRAVQRSGSETEYITSV
ncbi:monocarboxylate transporter 6-like isoform X1 [Acipenser ruthenus]|uniref:monocarboxylate transporter 6-like isoform X1 n=1 Tax=Acipenser ruthenus TaxID=7906 RepID=UPI001560756C|nr:monocarboxylate transporter 6-like isoform X1 [Acipenser ruthenus]XP_033894878.2 monocarboxylate transporter 6-like isoform X1 [Acipenser ruthenus]